MVARFTDSGTAKTVVDQLLADRTARRSSRHSQDIERIQSLRAAAVELLNDRGESVYQELGEVTEVPVLPQGPTDGMRHTVISLSDKWLELRWLSFETYAMRFADRYRSDPGRAWETLHARYRRVIRRLDQLERRR